MVEVSTVNMVVHLVLDSLVIGAWNGGLKAAQDLVVLVSVVSV